MGIEGKEVRFATKLARSAVKTLLLLFICVIALATAQRYLSERAILQQADLLAKAEAINGQILLADANLTNAAIAFATSGNTYWRKSYDEQVPVIDAAIADAKKLASSKVSAAFDTETRVANDKLIALETKAFELAESKNYAAALEVLRSPDYIGQKNILATGSERLLISLRNELTARSRNIRALGWATLALSLLIAVGIVWILWKRMTKALANSEKAFMDAEAEIRAELQLAHQEVFNKTKLSQLGQLTATIAHELRNPLGSVRTSAFLLQRKYASQQPAMASSLERIQSGVVRCDNIITQLLDFSRNVPAHKTEVVLDTWLENTLTELLELLPANVKLLCTLGLGDSKVGLDQERFRRVVINLISNASEAMVGKGDQNNTHDKAEPTIAIETKFSSRGIELVVSDNGPGISPEVMAKIFDPLFTTKSFGTGLGLPAVRRILEQHGGDLEVQSEGGAGATFTAWLPVTTKQSLAA